MPNAKVSFLRKHGGKLVMAFLGAIAAAVGKWAWDEYIKPKPLYVNIAVFDDSRPPKALKDVAVWLHLNDVEEKKTGDFGRVRFEIPRKHRREGVTPEFKLDGYSRISGPEPDKIILAESETNGVFVLTRNASATPTPSPTPTAAQYEVKTYTSGALPSGRSDQFSPWYTLCNDPVPADWTVAESSFVLTGDRQCGAWSECKKAEDNPTRVCWQFRMQGHSEQTGGLFNQGNTGIQFSTGNLRIVWKH